MQTLNFGAFRLSGAAAGFVSAAFLATLPLPAWAQSGPPDSNDVAAANPRVRPLDGGSVALPRPLSSVDAQLMRRLFADQAAGVPSDPADVQAVQDDALLRGSLLADRFVRQPAQAALPDLRAWLARYSSQPEAPAVHALLAARLPRKDVPPLANASALAANRIDPENQPAALDQPRSQALDHAVHEAARQGHADDALRLIARHRPVVGAQYGAQLKAEVAQALFTQGANSPALEVALAAQRQSGLIGLAPFVAGLVDWQANQPEPAAQLFEAASNARLASPALRSAASFWAARAHLRSGHPAAYRPWMRRAAAEPRSFYGLLARRALGLGIGFAIDNETLGEADVEAVAGLPAGQRAFALLQIGRPEAAEAELRTLWPATADNAALGRSLLLVSRAAGLTGLAAQLASLEQVRDGRLRDDARFPLPALAPRGGFHIDPSLIYALIRLESNFDPTAVSAAGARGLMQVMPVTASYLATQGQAAETAAEQLHEPAINLEVGQRYVQYLARQTMVAGDLIRLLASYNAGPGNVAKWVADAPDAADPLLFIEAIPFDETRGFVHRVLAYSWLYAARLGVPPRSLDELAAGAWPRFYGAPPPGGWKLASLH